MMLNRTPWWQYACLAVLAVLGMVYALPSFYGEDPAVTIAANQADPGGGVFETKNLPELLNQYNLPYLDVIHGDGETVVTFASDEEQLRAYQALNAALQTKAVLALNMHARAPAWLSAVGAHPMTLGLDLRGGVHFLLDVDVDAVVSAKLTNDLQEMKQLMREQNVRYTSAAKAPDGDLRFVFADETSAKKFTSLLVKNHLSYGMQEKEGLVATVSLKATVYQDLLDQVMAKNIETLRNRVNELGVAEAVVQQQGQHHISVDLPGIQDIAQAKRMIGNTATVQFQLVDDSLDRQAGSKLYPLKDSAQKLWLQPTVLLSGDSIHNAVATVDQQHLGYVINISLSASNKRVQQFIKATTDNIGKQLAVLYVERKAQRTKQADGEEVVSYRDQKVVISAPRINGTLGKNFQITGSFTQQEAQDLAMLLRSGSFAAPVDIVEERTVGPSLGADNIRKGVLSLVVGSLLVVVFMALYYRAFGLLANLALCLNVLFIVATLSVLGATLTLAGMAGIVLTVGMAVDANVLIYERIREELRLGRGVQMAIKLGYDRALVTIVDSNVTTLIVAVILFTLGSASVKGFAVTLTIGLLASMLTAIVFTRALVNALYGGKRLERISIGI